MYRRFACWLIGLVGVASLVAAGADAAPAKHRVSKAHAAHAAKPAAITDPTDPAYPFTNPNPEAEIGKLPNGLTYAVMRRPGTRKVSLILRIGAGSQNEAENERGVAHFMEHMAFNGSAHFPPGTVMQDFADIGVAIGRDQGAVTTFDATTFSLDVSEITPERLDLAFGWLRDVADGASIEQAQVDRERGVIMSEYVSSRSPLADASERDEAFTFPDLRAPKRLPIGLTEVIRTVNADTIRGFYERWYRPETSIVVAVGDLPRDALKARIIQAFGSWKDATPTPTPPNLGHIDMSRPTAALVIAEPKAPPLLQVCRSLDRDPDLKEGVISRTHDFEQSLWTQALDARLAALIDSPSPPFVSAQISRDRVFDVADSTCVDATLRDGDWKKALAAISTETRRMALYGLTKDEYDSGVKNLEAEVEASVGQAPTMGPQLLAQSILANLTTGGTFSTAEEDKRIGRMALAGLTRQQVDAEFARIWTHAAHPTIVMIDGQPEADSAVAKAWRVAEAGPSPARPPEHEGAAWAYTNFGPPGTVVSRDPVPGVPQAERISFANGVRMTFMFSRNAQDHVEIRIRFGSGQQELAVKDLPAAALGATLLRAGGLGKNSFEDTVRLCDGHDCEMSLAVGRDTFELAGQTRPSDLDVELQLIAAYLTDPGFRPSLDARIPTQVKTLDQLARSDPDMAAELARNQAMPPPRVPLALSEHDLDGVTSADFARILKPALTQDALEVTMVGDIDEDAAVQAVARTLGALPARERRDTHRPDAPNIRYPAVETADVRTTHDGSPEKAVVLATWPLFVWTPEKVREERTLELVAYIFQNQAIDDIRQRLGKAYSPAVGIDLARGGDQGALSVSISTAPDATGIVADELRQIARRLAEGDITPDMLERARRPILDNGAVREIANGWWIGVLDGSWAHPDQLAAAASWESDFTGINLDDVKAAAHKWLTPSPLMVISSPSTQAAAGSSKPRG